MKYIFTAFLFLFLFRPMQASHVLGGDLSYTALGGDSFLVKLQLFRDCNSGTQITAWKLDIKAIGGSASGSTTMSIISKKDTQYSCRGTAYYGVCLQYVVQTAIIKLSGNSNCKWLLSAYECCRNNAVYNLSNPASTGIYLSAELDKCISNSSPVFNPSAFDFAFADKNNSTNIFTATEPDGDSLVFAFEKAMGSGGSYASYKVTAGDTFYYDKPFGQKATVSLGQNDGELKLNCGLQQKFAVVVGVTEYRKDTSGTYYVIGKTRKDMQIVNKPFVPNAPILSKASTIDGCSGNEICFKDMPSDDKDTSDSVYVSLQTNLPQGANFNTRWVGRHQYWTLCWKTTDADTANSPFSFSIRATDDGCFFPAVTTEKYSINVNPMPHIDRTFTAKGCGVYSFHAQSKYGYLQEKIQWDVGGVAIGNSANGFTYDFGDTGTFVIHSKVVYNKCEQDYWDTVKVVDYLKLVLPADMTVCKGTQVGIQAKSNKSNTRFKWYTGNAADTLPFLWVKVNSDTFIVCTVINTNCSRSDTIHFYTPNLFNLTPLRDTTICDGQPVKLEAFYGNGFSYFWSTGEWTRSITVRTAGQYIVGISGTGSSCFTYDTVIIKANPLPKIANFLHDNAICNGQYVSIIAFIGGGYTYRWNTGDSSASISVNKPGTYVAIVTDTLTGCSNADTSTVYILNLPNPAFTYIRNGHTIDLSPLDTLGVAYMWQFGDGNTSTDTKPSYTYASQGDYTVKLTITGSNLCMSSDSQLVSLPLGVFHSLGEAISVWPNPFGQKLNITFPKEIKQIQLLDALGRLVLAANPSNGFATMDTEHLPSGIYFLKANASVIKVMKE